MKLRSPALERSLRRRVRQAVAASPALLKDSLAGRRARLWRLLGVAILAPIMIVGGIGFPLSVNSMIIGMELFIDGMVDRQGNGAELALLLHALALTGIALMESVAMLQQLLQSRELGVLSSLPVSDTGFYRRERNGLLLCGLFFAYVLFWAYGYFCWTQQVPFGGWLAAAGLALLQGLVFAALALLLVGRRPVTLFGSGLPRCQGSAPASSLWVDTCPPLR
jgi:hypothetical protein